MNNYFWGLGLIFVLLLCFCLYRVITLFGYLSSKIT